MMHESGMLTLILLTFVRRILNGYSLSPRRLRVRERVCCMQHAVTIRMYLLHTKVSVLVCVRFCWFESVCAYVRLLPYVIVSFQFHGHWFSHAHSIDDQSVTPMIESSNSFDDHSLHSFDDWSLSSLNDCSLADRSPADSKLCSDNWRRFDGRAVKIG